MQFDSRITTGLAWAGALLVVAIPTADFFMRQGDAPPQVSVVQEEIPEQVTLPTTSAERPAAATPAPVPTAQAPATPQPTGDKVIDSYLESGRELPSYISGESPSKPAAEAPKPQPVEPVTPTPAPPAPAAATPAPVETASLPRTRIVTLPTPASQRPAPAPVAVRPPVVEQAPLIAQPPLVAPQSVVNPPVSQPPLIVDDRAPIVSAEELDEWETGPLSDFLARRTGSPQPTQDFDRNGFFLDQGPNAPRDQPYPDAYDDEFYFPFGQ